MLWQWPTWVGEIGNQSDDKNQWYLVGHVILLNITVSSIETDPIGPYNHTDLRIRFPIIMMDEYLRKIYYHSYKCENRISK